MTAPEPTWHVAPDADGELTLWHGDIAVLRECDLATGGGGSATAARAYRRILFGLLGRVLAPDEATIERLAEAVHDAYLDSCQRLGWSVKPDNDVPYDQLSDAAQALDRGTVYAVLAALAAAPGPTDDEAVTPT